MIMIGGKSLESINQYLRNNNRFQIYQKVSGKPGMTFSELMKLLNFKEGTLRYHMNFLQKKKLIRSTEQEGRKRYYSIDAPSIAITSTSPNITGVQGNILEIIENNQGINQKDLSRQIRKNRFLVAYHIQSLFDMGLIRRERIGKKVHYYRVSMDELKKRMILLLVDDLLSDTVDEKKFLELKEKVEEL